MNHRIYLSGPMTGIKDYNFPAFLEAKAFLKSKGDWVFSPTETPKQKTWLDYMKYDIIELLDSQEICMLPGWIRSKGARIEFILALLFGLKISFYRNKRRKRNERNHSNE